MRNDLMRHQLTTLVTGTLACFDLAATFNMETPKTTPRSESYGLHLEVCLGIGITG